MAFSDGGGSVIAPLLFFSEISQTVGATVWGFECVSDDGTTVGRHRLPRIRDGLSLSDRVSKRAPTVVTPLTRY